MWVAQDDRLVSRHIEHTCLMLAAQRALRLLMTSTD